MSILKSIAAAFLCWVALGAYAQSPAQAPLDCSAGPLTRAYGGVPWLVYACSDDKTVVLMSAPGSPAAPFYFTFFQKEGRYVLGGEGTGARSVTDRAHAELAALSQADVRGLLVAAKAAASSGARK